MISRTFLRRRLGCQISCCTSTCASELCWVLCFTLGCADVLQSSLVALWSTNTRRHKLERMCPGFISGHAGDEKPLIFSGFGLTASLERPTSCSSKMLRSATFTPKKSACGGAPWCCIIEHPHNGFLLIATTPAEVTHFPTQTTGPDCVTPSSQATAVRPQ